MSLDESDDPSDEKEELVLIIEDISVKFVITTVVKLSPLEVVV